MRTLILYYISSSNAFIEIQHDQYFLGFNNHEA